MTKLERMKHGEAVELTINELETLEAWGVGIRTARNAKPGKPYIGWMSGRLCTSPPKFRIDRTNDFKATAVAGRCHYSFSLEPLEEDYSVIET